MTGGHDKGRVQTAIKPHVSMMSISPGGRCMINDQRINSHKRTYTHAHTRTHTQKSKLVPG